MDKWEYTEATEMDEIIELGQRGWEAVAQTSGGTVLLKRPAASLRDELTDASVKAFFAAGEQEMGEPEGGSKLLNPDLAYIVRNLGHTDMLVISDMGFPMPELQYNLDLALKPGVPTVPEVLDAISTDFSFDRIIIAAEAHEAVPERVAELEEAFGVRIEDVESHVAFKHMAERCKAGVRSGDSTPFGNVIVVCG
jgi:D-ribose pyranase